mmetsp:Transcript_2388/g.7064  ORF Transcript_2388/g.7064 Transcript_2388/m.7064 type:complete len:294 (-) Transcript_2388:301-1182(-)
MAAKCLPVAIPWAPVRVAMSTMTPGLRCLTAYAAPSAITSRPSASVLFTSTVLPEYMCSTSSGRVDSLDSEFSAMQRTATTRRLHLSSASARKAPRAAPAPPMSRFIPTMAVLPFRLAPPVSYTMPLPTITSAGDSAVAPSPTYSSTTSAGRCSEALPTPHSPPKPLSRSSVPAMTVTLVAPASLPTSVAISTNRSVCRMLVGMSTSAAVMRTDSAVCDRLSTASASMAPSGVAAVTWTTLGFASADLREKAGNARAEASSMLACRRLSAAMQTTWVTASGAMALSAMRSLEG